MELLGGLVGLPKSLREKDKQSVCWGNEADARNS